MPKVDLVVFDMAGTTVKDEDEVKRCFLEAASRTGLQAEAAKVVSMMGWPKRLVFETLWREQLGQTHPDYASKVEASFSQFREILEHHYKYQPVHPTEGCLELFAWLKSQGIKIALTTGFYREVTTIILHRLGWDLGLSDDYLGAANSVIQASLTPSEIFKDEGRPAPFMIQKAMYRLGVTDSQRVINIGDTPSDLAAGFNANCLLSLGVTNGTHTREQLADYPNDGLLSSLPELKAKIVDL